MSTFHVTYEVADLARSRWCPIDDALVDTGSSFSVAPRTVLQELGILPAGKVPCTLGDGRVVYADVAEVRTKINDRDWVDIIMFGETGEPSLLGAHTLEAHLLAVDPHNNRLVPVTSLRMLKSSP